MHSYRHSPYSLQSVPNALGVVLQQIAEHPTPHNTNPNDALGLVVASEVVATEPLPPFPASVVDGYAVVAEDGEGSFPVISLISAGMSPSFSLCSGSIVQITTGSPVPEGANAVVMVEDTESLGFIDGKEIVKIKKAAKPGQFIRKVGSDINPGQVILSPGEQISATEIGLLATCGITKVTVYKPPKVGVLSTGDELVEPEQTPKFGQIRDSNRSMLIAALESLGFIKDIVDLGIGMDDRQTLENLILKSLSDVDVLITSGGVSMGEFDLLKPILESNGKIHFGRILMKPGKPCTFATIEINNKKKFVFGLPGNPVSSMVTFQIMVLPALRKLSGFRNPHLPVITVKTANDLKLDPERPEYHRATTVWDNKQMCFVATTTGLQASSRLLSMKTANTLLLLPQQSGILRVGSTVEAFLIGPISTT